MFAKFLNAYKRPKYKEILINTSLMFKKQTFWSDFLYSRYLKGYAKIYMLF